MLSLPTFQGGTMRLDLRAAPILIGVALAAIPLGAYAQPATLDGKAFVADAGEKGKPADEKNDVITFAGGTVHSSACDQYGYGKGKYKAVAAGDAVSFEAETTSAKDGRIVGKGRIRGSD